VASGLNHMHEFGEWRYTVDREATRTAYTREPAGGAATCTCNGCRNFVAARDRILPPQLVAFLESLGIDPTKDAEAYHCGRVAPGRHHYGGWYHFVGTLDVTGDLARIEFSEGFFAWMSTARAPRIASLQSASVVELAFSTDRAPWVLNEPEAE
jgi:hypothetical protein